MLVENEKKNCQCSQQKGSANLSPVKDYTHKVRRSDLRVYTRAIYVHRPFVLFMSWLREYPLQYDVLCTVPLD